MIVLADFPEINPNAIIVVVAVIFAAIKAFIEKKQGAGEEGPPALPEDGEEEYDPYLEYEAELERQRKQLEIEVPVQVSKPPPLSGFTPGVPQRVRTPIRPKLSEAESKALANLNLTSRRRKKRSGGKSTKSRVYLHLSSPTAAREALVLADVLGPPKALKEE